MLLLASTRLCLGMSRSILHICDAKLLHYSKRISPLFSFGAVNVFRLLGISEFDVVDQKCKMEL
jgi:hypothetical protein